MITILDVFLLFLYFAFILSAKRKHPIKFNLISKEIEESYSSKYLSLNNSFIILDHLQKFIPNYSLINLYISVNNFLKKNSIEFNSTKESYYSNYNSFIGKSDRFFINELKINPFIHNVNTNSKDALNNTSESLIRKVIFNNTIFLWFIKNQFNAHFKSINLTNPSYDLFDFNIIFNIKNETKIEGKEGDKFYLSYDNYSDFSYNEFLSKVFEESKYSEIINNPLVQRKILRQKKINQIMERLEKNNNTKINLNSHLLFSQIRKVEKKLEKIEEYLLSLKYYGNDYKDKEFEEECNKLEKSINDLLGYINGFNFNRGDWGIYGFYFCFLLIICISVMNIIYKSYYEFKDALYKKEK